MSSSTRATSAPPTFGNTPSVMYRNCGIQTSPPRDGPTFFKIHGKKPEQEDLERKIGIASIGRYKTPTETFHGLQRGAVFLAPKSVQKPTYVDSAFQTLESQPRQMALAKAKAKASMWVKRFTNAVARQGFSIKTAPHDKNVEHSEQFPLSVKIDNDGKVADGGVATNAFLPNLYLHEKPADSKHSITAQAPCSTSFSPSASTPPQPIPALEPSLLEITDEPTNTWDSEDDSGAYASSTDVFVVHDASCSPPQSKTTETPAPLEPSCKRKDTPHDADTAEPRKTRTKSESSQPKALHSRQIQDAHKEHVETQAKMQTRDLSRTRQKSRAQSPERRNKHSKQKDNRTRDTGERQDDLRGARGRSMSPARHDSSEYRDRKEPRNIQISKVESPEKRNPYGSSKKKDDHTCDTVDRRHDRHKARHRSRSPVRRSRSPVGHDSSGFKEHSTSRTGQASRAQSPEKRIKYESSKKKSAHTCDTVDRRHDSRTARHDSRSLVRRSRSPVRRDSSSLQQPSGYRDRKPSHTMQASKAQSPERYNKHELSKQRNNDTRNNSDKAGHRHDPYGSRRRSKSPVRHDSSSLQQPSKYRDRNDSHRTRGRSNSPMGRNTLSDTRARYGKDNQADKTRATQVSKVEMKSDQTPLPRTSQVGGIRVRGVAEDSTDVAQVEGISVRGAARNATALNSTPTLSQTSTPASAAQNTASNNNGEAQAGAGAPNQGRRRQKRSLEEADPTTELNHGQQPKRAKPNPEITQAEDAAALRKREIQARIAARHANDAPKVGKAVRLYRAAGRR
jgi:hypothetical protein